MTQRRIYQEEFPYFITFRTRGGFELFKETKYARLLADIIFKAGRLKQYDILAFQIMPDHVHMLVWDAIAGRDTRDVKEMKNFSIPGRNIYRAYPSVGALHSKMGSAGRDAHARGNKMINPERVSVPAMGSKIAPALGAEKINISQLMHAVKSFYCDQIRYHNSIKYSVFQRRFYTRIISNRKYLKNILWYIEQNSVKAKLPKEYQNMPYQYINRRLINKLF